MAQKGSKKGGKNDRGSNSRLDLIGLTDADERPQITVYALDRAGKVIDRAEVGADGGFALSPKAIDGAHKVAIGPEADFADIDRARLKVLRAGRIKELMAANLPLEVARSDWLKWLMLRRCVKGTVRHCYPYPFFRLQLARRLSEVISASPAISANPGSATRVAAQPVARELRTTAARVAGFATVKAADNLIARPFEPIWPHRCEPVCDGIVEVYRRTCCCTPWIIFDPRLPELIAELERIVPPFPEEVWPPIKWPPRPEPDPVPFDALERAGAVKSGALVEQVLNARRDLVALRSLPAAEVPTYINARPYLLCWLKCGPPVKVAQGRIDPDGGFHICWWEWPRLMLPHCHDEFAFVVRQNVDGATVTIYDGLSAGQWFHHGDEPVLTSYHPDAQGCRHNDFPGEGAFALLQDIGLAGSYRLKTPDATGWDRVAAPAYNDGLADPVANPLDAIGKYRNRNWGGLLRLRYHFSEAMRALGAKYYRVSVVAADANGDPTGARTPLAPAQWRYYEVVGADIHVKKVALGPDSQGGQDDLYEIPYDADRDWQSGQYHALLDTTGFANGRFLLTLEIFDAAGMLLRPTGTPNPGGSLEAAFTYRRWWQEVGPTAEVPFAALTHMLWWDNREAVANIVDLRLGGVPNTAECQFLVGTAASNFSIGYRAYHQQPMFLLDHRVWWRRGLGGPSGILTSPHPNPNNVGVPPAPAHESGTDTFADMLGPHAKCSFTVNLHVNVKTFNGIGTLNGLDDWDQAAFALEIAAPASP